MEKEIKNVLAETAFGFKKRFGQNFITDMNLLRSIVGCAGVCADDTVIEIGCGAGTLTRAIAEKAAKVTAFEIDETLRPVLARTTGSIGNVSVVFADFMKINLAELEKTTGEYKVVANLPYYITTPLIMKIMDESRLCKSLTVMVQEEVAARLCAEQNTPEYGAVTAVVALRADAEIVKKVPRTVFYPVPNVDSAVVRLTLRDGRIAVKDAKMYKKTVRAAFSARRKTLVNNLMSAFPVTRGQAESALSECGIDLRARGETLSPEQFAVLSDKIKEIII